ncbi:MAG: hypothetical protein C0404_01580 [Verrucomicrobia bacterium]|nr:hypothetical protein [Verrucomicrobiota bacterium]
MKRCTIQISAAMVIAGSILYLAGCKSQPIPLEPIKPRVELPPRTTPVATAPAAVDKPATPATPKEIMKQEEQTGQLVKFGKLRTVISAREQIVDKDGKATAASEIKPLVEKQLVDRDFRIFSDAVPPDTKIAEMARKVKAHLLISIDAKSEFVNSTGMFSKYRASAEAKAVRGHDGTELVVIKTEAEGPREQDPKRAGLLALRELQNKVAKELMEGLLGKTDQLLWAGLMVNNVQSMEAAVQIQNALEKNEVISYVELIDWSKQTQVAVFEIIYGAKHESDLATALQGIPGVKIKLTKYEPANMEVLKKQVTNYK